MQLNRAKTFAVEQGRHPLTGALCEFKISTELVMKKHKFGPNDVFYNLHNVPFAIQQPTAIFKGLDREGHEGSYCYCACPAQRFVSDGESYPLKDGFVFLVFVTDGLEIFDWRFEKSDDKDEQLPKDHEKRFREQVWRTNH